MGLILPLPKSLFFILGIVCRSYSSPEEYSLPFKFFIKCKMFFCTSAQHQSCVTLVPYSMVGIITLVLNFSFKDSICQDLIILLDMGSWTRSEVRVDLPRILKAFLISNSFDRPVDKITLFFDLLINFNKINL